MRREFILTTAIIALVSGSALAAVTVEQTTDPEFLINSGYSQLTAEDVFMQKNRALGNPIEPLYDTTENRFVRGLKRIQAYIDPLYDSHDRIHHDIRPNPSVSDL